MPVVHSNGNDHRYLAQLKNRRVEENLKWKQNHNKWKERERVKCSKSGLRFKPTNKFQNKLNHRIRAFFLSLKVNK